MAASIAILASVVVGTLAGAALAEPAPPMAQYNTGVPIHEVQCRDSKELMETPRRTPACVSESSVEKLLQRGWAVVRPLQDRTEHPDVRAELPAKTMTTGNVNNTWTGLSSLGWGSYLWPQYSLTFPERVRVGEQFEIVLDYTFILHAADYDRYGVADIMGFPTEREKVWCAVECIENLRGWNSTFRIERNAYVALLNDTDYVMTGRGYDERHIPVREFESGTVPPVFNNTHPQQKTFTFVINDPDTEYPFGQIRIDWNGDGKGRIYFYVEPGNAVRLSGEPIIVEGEGVPRLGLNLPDLPPKPTPSDPLSGISDPENLMHDLAPFLEEHYPDRVEAELRLANFTDAFIDRFFELYPDLRTQS